VNLRALVVFHQLLFSYNYALYGFRNDIIHTKAPAISRWSFLHLIIKIIKMFRY